ncbi:hypothetical protein U3516DRAFT_768939 [Neocallimastix sp. 'constans']
MYNSNNNSNNNFNNNFNKKFINNFNNNFNNEITILEVETLLFIACKNGDKNLETIFIDSWNEDTVLFYSCKSGNDQLKIKMEKQHDLKPQGKIIKGTDLRKENRYNETSLFATCKKKKSENEPIVPYLIELGNKIPLDISYAHGNDILIGLLIKNRTHTSH